MNTYNPDTQLVTELALINCRELGGMPLAGGKTFRKGIFLRSGSPEWLNEVQFQEVKAYGVKTVIDLRAPAELEETGNPFQNDPDTDFHNIPLFNGNPNLTEDATMEYIRTHTLGDYYVIIAEEMADSLVKIMRVLLNAEGLALFHCAHGKDRTGVIAALLYLISGASHEDIVNNYKVSYDYLKDFLEPFIQKMPADLRHALRSDAHNMETFLSYMDTKWNGDAGKFLCSNGLTESELNALKLKCIEG